MSIELGALRLESHPLLEAGLVACELAEPLAGLPSPDWLVALLAAPPVSPDRASPAVRGAVRDLLRHAGYKPAGRGKPASEFLARAAERGALRPINAAVDVCNAVSLRSGLPISVVDLDRTRPPLSIRVADDDATYVFNPSGQSIRLGGLICLHDADGACANAVKDAQRTKTADGTTRTLSVVWGTAAVPGATAAAVDRYRALLERLGATISVRIACAAG